MGSDDPLICPIFTKGAFHVKHRRIAILLNTTYDHPRAVLVGIQQAALENNDWDALAFRGEYPPPEALMHWRADAIVGAFNATTYPVAPYLPLEIPIVNVSSAPQDAPVHNVQVDHIETGRMAADHLMELSPLSFGLLTLENRTFSRLRAQGYRERLAAAGHDVHEYTLPDRLTFVLGGLQEWLASLSRPAGVFGVGDTEAQMLFTTARDAGLHIPADIGILGANNDTMTCEACRPALSSIETNARAIGYHAAGLLKRLLDGDVPDSRDTLLPPGDVIRRGSTDPAAMIHDPLVREALHLAALHLPSGWDINGICRHMGISTKTLELHFAKSLGRSPLQELHRIRFERACTLLRGTDLSIAAVARAVGCARASHFTSFFRSRATLSPSEFRAKRNLV